MFGSLFKCATLLIFVIFHSSSKEPNECSRECLDRDENDFANGTALCIRKQSRIEGRCFIECMGLEVSPDQNACLCSRCHINKGWGFCTKGGTHITEDDCATKICNRGDDSVNFYDVNCNDKD